MSWRVRLTRRADADIEGGVLFDGAFEVLGEPLAAPVLLVDDVVDSRWTFAVAAWLLRSHGSGEVWPFALSYSGGLQE